MDTAERILRLLRREPVVSGEALSDALGISRAAVWKHVEALRAAGYRIDAQRARGYALTSAPDRLLPAEIERHLATERFGRRLACFETIDSTNLRAATLAREDAPEGTLVLAERQTAGRGRLGRSWVSPARVNLYASFVLRPRLAPADGPQLALAAAVAVARALRTLPGLAPGRVAIKWPNDCLLDGRKVAGILTEMDAEVDRIRSVVLGIGVNLNASAGAFPAELRDTATSVLLATGARVDRPRFAAALCGTLEAIYDRVVREGFGALAPEWESYSCLTGRVVTVECAGRRRTGTVRGIDAGGRLVLEGSEGEARIMAGDVSIVDGYRMLGRTGKEERP
ncbi:MAG: biotin--[acetyl-CoA-carboxylase] ligase [Deltaproteobacteria bacterium]|nr:biotin--[acetyl-CoA-carboxylase] ligase [Deltaproteobacteria bacterium]